ncbi:MAG: hypothetical protein JSR09_10740 [Bacteroidetes bacterium]|nr:hypothetical protein [Bacteroidota bacterium]MBS1650167.1 hypothetical protein [Bacteroidota bacterium]
MLISSCGIYTFRDSSIDYKKFKTIKIGVFDNKARYVNPQLAPQLNDKLQQKIAGQTKLIRTNNDNADLQIDGYISSYDVTTTAITTQQATANRLTVAVHLIVKNLPDNKTDEFDVSRSFDFSANLSLEQAQTNLMSDILKNITDEIFNHLFSNW